MPAPDYLAPYQKAAEEHGPTFRATLWNSPQKQLIRFEVLASMHDLTGRRILDAGAGLGDFAYFLLKRRIRFAEYLGLEGVARLAEAASARGLRRASFRAVDFAEQPDAFLNPFNGAPADVIVFSGSLNTFEEDAARRTLASAWDGAREALIFNFLSTRRAPQGAAAPPPAVAGDPARRFDPLAMLDWALARTPSVRFRQDYFDGHDATICMYKR